MRCYCQVDSCLAAQMQRDAAGRGLGGGGSGYVGVCRRSSSRSLKMRLVSQTPCPVPALAYVCYSCRLARACFVAKVRSTLAARSADHHDFTLS